VVTVGTHASEARRVADEAGEDWVVIVDDAGTLRGWTFVDELAETIDGAAARPFVTSVHATDSLRTALDALVSSWTGVAVRVSDGDHYEGLLSRELLTAELQDGAEVDR
jgi:osmoprotectant transport system ATP-binding protein